MKRLLSFYRPKKLSQVVLSSEHPLRDTARTSLPLRIRDHNPRKRYVGTTIGVSLDAEH